MNEAGGDLKQRLDCYSYQQIWTAYGLTNLRSGTIVGHMTSLPLRELLRHPAVVKRLTAAGESVQVTDNGKPLWVLRSATVPALADADRQLVDDELDAMLAERRSTVSAGQLIVDSRMP